MGCVLDPEPDSSPEKDDKSFVVLSNSQTLNPLVTFTMYDFLFSENSNKF